MKGICLIIDDHCPNYSMNAHIGINIPSTPTDSYILKTGMSSSLKTRVSPIQRFFDLIYAAHLSVKQRTTQHFFGFVLYLTHCLGYHGI